MRVIVIATVLFLVLVMSIASAREPDSENASTCSLTVNVFLNASRSKGRVSIWSEAAFPTALIDCHPSTVPPLRSQVTQEGHRVKFSGLAVGAYMLAADIEGYPRTYLPVRLLASGNQVDVDLTVRGGSHEFRGRVVWGDGKSFQGVVHATLRSTCHTPAESSFSHCMAETNEEGAFRFAGLAADRYLVSVTAPGRFLSSHSWSIMMPPPADMTLIADEGIVRRNVVVVDHKSQRPIPNVAVSSTSWQGTQSQHATDKEGRVWVRGGSTFTFAAKGYATLRRELDEFEEPLRVAMERGASVRGVISIEGAERPGLEVTVAAMRVHQGDPTEDVHVTVANEKGEYSIEGLKPGRWLIAAIGRRWASVDGGIATVEGLRDAAIVLESDATTEHRIHMRRTLAMHVNVRDPSGHPVSRVRVAAVPEQQLRRFAPFLFHEQLRPHLTGQTNKEGRAHLDTILPGMNYVVMAESADCSMRTLNVAKPKKDRPLVVNVTLPPLRSMDVLVLDDKTGRPIPSAYVTVRDDLNVGLACWLTNQAGSASLCYRSNTPLRVDCEKIGYMELDSPVTSDPNGMATIRLKRSLSISGVVRCPEEVKGVVARVKTETDSPGHFFLRGKTAFDCAPAGNRFVLRNLSRGVHRMSAQLKWKGTTFRGTATAEAGRTDVEILLKPFQVPKPIQVSVVDPDRKPVVRAKALLFVEGIAMHRAPRQLTVRDGRLRFAVPNGATRLAIEIYGATDEKRNALGLGPREVGPIPPSAFPKLITLPEGRRIEGRIVDASGRPVANAQIIARPRRSFEARRPEQAADALFRFGASGPSHANARSNDRGEFVLVGLGNKPYQLDVNPPKGFAHPEPVPAVLPGYSPQRIVLVSAPTVTIGVVDRSGQPLAGARVLLWWKTSEGKERNHSSTFESMTTDSSGSISFYDLHPKRHCRLRIDPPEDREDLQVIRVDQWLPRSNVFRFKRSYEIVGHVRDRSGEPVAGIHVGIRKEAGHLNLVTTDESGEFRFSDLDKKRYNIQVSDDLHRKHGHLPSLSVLAGITDAVLEIDKRRLLKFRYVRSEVERGPPGIMKQAELWTEDGELVGSIAFPLDDDAVLLELESNESYAVLGRASFSGARVFRRGVRTGADVIVLREARSGTIRGSLALSKDQRIESAEGFATCGGAKLSVDVNTNGAWSISHVPPESTWHVTITGLVSGRHVFASGRVELGKPPTNRWPVTRKK